MALVYGLIVLYVSITVGVSLGENSYQGSGEGGHCFLAQGRFFDGFWIAPVIIVQVMAVINTLAMLVYSFGISSKPRMAIRFIAGQWRILAFRFIFLGASASVSIFWLVWRPRNSDIVDSIIDWLGCSASEFQTLLASCCLSRTSKNSPISDCILGSNNSPSCGYCISVIILPSERHYFLVVQQALLWSSPWRSSLWTLVRFCLDELA